MDTRKFAVISGQTQTLCPNGHAQPTDHPIPSVRYWRTLIEKPARRPSHVLVIIDREGNCEAFLSGKMGGYAAAPPMTAVRSLWLICRAKRFAPDEVMLDIDPAAPERRRQQGLQAYQWLIQKIRLPRKKPVACAIPPPVPRVKYY